MKLWKKKQAAALSLAVLMALPGCQTPDPGTSGSGTSDPSAQQVEAAATDPTHIYEEVGGNFLIDAEISGPPEGVVPKVYRGHYKSFSKEEVDAFLEQVGDSVAEIRSDGIEGKDYCYSGACTSGGSFSTCANADGTTMTSDFSYNRRKNKIYEYPIYINQDDYNDSKEIRLAYLFEEPTDMACGTAAEAEEAIRMALSALGLSDIVLNRTLYISHDRMAQADELMQTEEWSGSVKGGEISQFQGNDWSEADDCYMFEFFCGQGRQEFQRMLNDIQDCKDGVSYVLVFKLSRFGRNAADVLNSLQLMQDFGVNLICVEDGIDSSKDAGKLMISVLSAVAEIERENIRTQTMAGREQKAREGKWNGGFAPYGYKLEDGNLVIAEDEVEVIRVIYDRYIHTNEGVAGVAKYLNRNGYVKKLRQNNTIPGFSRDFVKNVLYNPVYMGKIAYGRRRTEKKQGTRNEMHVVEQSEFPVYEGQHEAIISEEDWHLAQEKRKINSFKREKVNNPDHAHILSGILKCPCCGKSMYGNIAKAHSKDKKTRYYYYCKNTVTPTGHECSFRLNIEQTEINKFVAKIISAMVNNPRFVEAIQAKIGTAVDTEDMEKQIAVLQGQLKQAFGTKSRLERQMDTLDINDVHYDRKILDLQRRYDEQYDTIEEIEVQIGELQSQIRNIQQEKISGDNIYRLLLAFDEVYHSATEAEQKEFMKAFIERIEMFPEKRKDGSWIKKIVFNFPVPVDGEEVKELPLETETTVETVCLLSRKAQ